jgi:hypothetical protein
MLRRRAATSKAEQLAEALQGVLASHAAWHDDGSGAMFYIVDGHILCVPDPGSVRNPDEMSRQEAAHDQLAEAFGLRPLEPGGDPPTKRLRVVTGDDSIRAGVEWHPPLPDRRT